MPTDEEQAGRLSRLREYDLRPAIPILVLFALYHLFMPATGSPPLWSLDTHQQVIAMLVTPTTFGSLYWFLKANGFGKEKSPEEGVLDE